MKAPHHHNAMNSQQAVTTTSSGSGSSTTTASNSSSSSDSQNQRDSRLTVADILSSMANGEAITPTTFATMEGFSTGIPTRTTPTLTPTTLRNIEQTFIELQSVPPPLHHQHQAGFVPPIVHTNGSASQNANYTIKEEPMWYSPTERNTACSSMSGRLSSSSASSTSSTATMPPVKTKSSGRMGGRRPKRDEKNLSPEEEERRRVRRERNKLAAARCRKRRLDHTNVLLEETEGLEDKKQELQKEIHELQNQKEQLEFILEAHRCMCKSRKLTSGSNGSSNNNSNRNMNAMKSSSLPEEHDYTPATTVQPPTTYASESNYPSSKPLARPTSLSISQPFTVPSSSHSTTSLRLNTSVSVTEVAGIPITTPSEGMFNFAALMEGGTGLTPVSTGLTPVVPTCSSQQRSSSSDLSSPDTINGPKLVSL